VNEIAPFDFDGQPVRVLEHDGEPWWVLRDVLDVLGIANPSDAVAGLDDDEFGNTEVVDSAGRRQPNSYVVSESGLYSLILRSRKPEAKAFKRWITHEVLPQIRKTGAYRPDGEARQELPATPADRIDALGAAVRSGFVPRKQGQRQADEILADLGLAERPRTAEEERLDIALRWVRRDHEVGDTFSARDFHRALNGQYWVRTIHDTDAVLDSLVGSGHLRRQPRPTTLLRGRPPSPRFEVLATRREIGGAP
jgi:prophage antirepressor-like protein